MSKITTEQMRFWSPEVRELEPYTPGEQPKIQNLLKLNTNENPYPPSPKVVEAVQNVLANGADVLRLYPDITYSFYPVYSQFFGVETKVLPLNDDFEIVVDDYKQPNGGIIITNPNAPTSIALGLCAIEEVLQANPNSVVVIDEAYVDFGAESAVVLVEKYDNLVVCQTTSKSRSLAGLRVGFAIAQPHLIAALEAVKNSFNSYPMDRFAIAAAVASFEDQAYFEAQNAKVIASREKLTAQLKELGFNVLPSAANFIFASLPSKDAGELAAELRKHGIIVRYFNKPRINQFLRITIGTDEQSQRLIDTLKNEILI